MLFRSLCLSFCLLCFRYLPQHFLLLSPCLFTGSLEPLTDFGGGWHSSGLWWWFVYLRAVVGFWRQGTWLPTDGCISAFMHFLTCARTSGFGPKGEILSRVFWSWFPATPSMSGKLRQAPYIILLFYSIPQTTHKQYSRLASFPALIRLRILS